MWGEEKETARSIRMWVRGWLGRKGDKVPGQRRSSVNTQCQGGLVPPSRSLGGDPAHFIDWNRQEAGRCGRPRLIEGKVRNDGEVEENGSICQITNLLKIHLLKNQCPWWVIPGIHPKVVWVNYLKMYSNLYAMVSTTLKIFPRDLFFYFT